KPPLIIPAIKKRGRIKKPKSLKLLETFIDRKEQILRFVHNKDVPFDNNLAERDIRMVKLKQKISGCFRTLNGAQVFCRIRSYISTTRKQGHTALDAIEMAISGKPINLICEQ
ncbi:MAG: transposase, partial [Bacteroidales bacterium]